MGRGIGRVVVLADEEVTLVSLEAAGFLDLLEPSTVVAVEWAERFPEALPADRIELRIERPADSTDPSSRVLHATGSGPASEAVLERWRAALTELGRAGSGRAAGVPRSLD